MINDVLRSNYAISTAGIVVLAVYTIAAFRLLDWLQAKRQGKKGRVLLVLTALLILAGMGILVGYHIHGLVQSTEKWW